MQKNGILILDFGSQYTLLIAKALRECSIYAEVLPSNLNLETYQKLSFKPHGIILSGGPDSVLDENSQQIPDWLLKQKLPTLGICYGMQLIGKHFGATVVKGKSREFGQAKLTSKQTDPLFTDFDFDSPVWMSHGDHLETAGDSFDVLAHSSDKKSVDTAKSKRTITAIKHRGLDIYGLQFHPEVAHSTQGKTILKNFYLHICNQTPNWTSKNTIQACIEACKKTVGSGKVLMAVSGGVDSSVAATLLSRTLEPDQLHCVFVDHGLLRKDEAKWVEENLKKAGIKNLHVIQAQKTFLSKLAGVSDPEKKRKIIGETFIETFDRLTESIEGITHLGQGTLYPDVIESAGSGHQSKVIKSHHNVGGLPEHMKLKLVEPFRMLFKDEVREVGRELGLPENLVDRHPFPGPGLAIRIAGEVDEEKIKILQQADDIFIRGLREYGLYDKIWQAFAVFLPVKSVGVTGDNRAYGWTICLRAVAAKDGMTAKSAVIDFAVLDSISKEIIQSTPEVARVLYDITSKPPATIEWE